ncbi:MAG: rRNA maturation RNase YbeY [Desulfobacterales bacterium]|nr:rRNA maturation RNase YbeY [Desulfobacterales bacterium]
MEVLIDNRQKKYKISLKQIQKKAKAILNALDCPDTELSILIVDDPQIAVFNEQYLNRNGPTNVIAFPMRTGPYANITPQLLGDVLISVETAFREGKRVGISMEERFTQLLVHGILHLLGYDHETSDQDAHEMEKKSKEILKLIGFHP